ncbi:putative MFS monocarboxylate transporter [Apodospora peruviana]|uniref:MFS monocarboxylate transporter n=1 Tax=Apodospora peruviana TaxID=516989 RepID=A0AAE0HVQ4_9PEZI|nr:putative MFS monocarboxylate transporter [Apodospora peruviana]
MEFSDTEKALHEPAPGFESDATVTRAQQKPIGNTSEVNFRSCLTVLGGSLAVFCSVGFVNAFGVFQEYYKQNMLQDKSESDISWIGSVSIFLIYILSPVAGIVVDRFGPTTLLASGSLGLLVAVFTTSLCTKYYQFFLAQAVLLGASMAFLTLPPISVVSRCLPKHRGLAVGLVVGGSSIGGVVWPIMLERLLSTTDLGFGWVMRIVGFTMLPLLAFACATVREPLSSSPQQLPPAVAQSLEDSSENSRNSNSTKIAAAVKEPKTKAWDISIIKNQVFLCLCLGLALAYFGLFIPFFYVSSYAISRGIDAQLSFYLIAIMNGASLFGRTIPGHFADRWGYFNMILFALATSAITGFCWTAATSLAGLIVWSLAYGFASGAILTLQSACAGKIATHQTQGTAMGILMGALSVTSLVGSPIGGSLVSNHGYLALSMFTGATLIAGTFFVVVSGLLLNREVFVAV